MKCSWVCSKLLSHARIISKLNNQILFSNNSRPPDKTHKYTGASSEQQIICKRTKSQQIFEERFIDSSPIMKRNLFGWCLFFNKYTDVNPSINDIMRFS